MNRWLKKLSFVGCVFFFTMENYLMAQESNIQTLAKSGQKSVVTIDDFTLKNGQTVWYTKDVNLDVITIGLCFQYAGNQSNPKDKTGLSEFLASMLDEGAGPYNSQEFKKKLIEFNIQLDIYSSQDNFVVLFKTTSENIDNAFNLLKTALTEPSFSNESFARVKQQISASLMQSLHKPECIAKEKILSIILGDDHVYAKSTKEQLLALKNISKSDLNKHLKKTLTQSNLIIAASGNISEEKLKNNLENFLSDLPKGEVQSQTPQSKLLSSGKVVHVEMDVPQTVIMFAHPGIDRKDPDFYAAYLLIQCLGGNAFESHLWKEIREKRGLAYYVSLGFFYQKLHSAFMGSTATKTSSTAEVIQLIREQWEKIANDGPSADELDLQKKFINESYPLSFTTTSDIVKALISYQNDGLTKDYVNERQELFNKVSLDDIKRVAKRLLKAKELTFLVLGKKES